MEPANLNLITDFEDGTVSRRSFLSRIAVTTTAAAAVAPVVAAAPAPAAAASAIKRTTMVPGLAPPAAVPAYSHVTSSTRKRLIFVAGQLARDDDGVGPHRVHDFSLRHDARAGLDQQAQ